MCQDKEITTDGKEIWKEITGYEGWYMISNHGRIRSWHKEGNSNDKRKKPTILSTFKSNRGYSRVNLWKDNNCKHYSVHRVVAKHFIPNPKNKPQVNHKDFNKSNNHVSNLEWVTCSENRMHAMRGGRVTMPDNKGENSGRAKLTRQDVLEIRKRYKNEDISQRKLGRIYGVSCNSIKGIVKRYTWKHI